MKDSTHNKGAEKMEKGDRMLDNLIDQLKHTEAKKLVRQLSSLDKNTLVELTYINGDFRRIIVAIIDAVHNYEAMYNEENKG